MEFMALIFLAVVALGLGFIALLKQKTYLDAKSGAVTSVEVPFVGKLQTNYPALVFVFVGLAFGYFAYEIKTNEGTKPFTVTGQLKSPESVADWSSAEINVRPSSVRLETVDPNGQYHIDLEIPKGQTFEGWLDAITFQLGVLSGRISPNADNDTSKKHRRTESYLDADVNMEAIK